MCLVSVVLTQEEALQQVVILRKELEEMRAIHSTRKQVDQTFGDLASCMDVTQMSTLREISEAFEMSENLVRMKINYILTWKYNNCYDLFSRGTLWDALVARMIFFNQF